MHCWWKNRWNKTRVESDQPGFSLNLILVLSLKLPIRLKILDNDIYLNYLVSKSCWIRKDLNRKILGLRKLLKHFLCSQNKFEFQKKSGHKNVGSKNIVSQHGKNLGLTLERKGLIGLKKICSPNFFAEKF